MERRSLVGELFAALADALLAGAKLRGGGESESQPTVVTALPAARLPHRAEVLYGLRYHVAKQAHYHAARGLPANINVEVDCAEDKHPKKNRLKAPGK